uniref:Ovule protein n=1 Tax=Ascaris lumbricoides TaxID=6252 RepID=A0A0M3HME2_ASCLU
MAARPSQSIDEDTSANGDSQKDHKQSYIEVYTKSIQVVESMLKLDRLRQEVAINSMLNKLVFSGIFPVRGTFSWIFSCVHKVAVLN